MKKQKVQVHMLPTENASLLFVIDNSRNYVKTENSLSYSTVGGRVHLTDIYKPQNLYFTSSDEKIKEGDWCIVNGGLGRIGVDRYQTNVKYSIKPLKIVATTDKSLNQSLLTELEYIELRRIRNNLRDDSQNYNYPDYKKALAKIKQYDLALSEYENLLPQIPQSFIKQYVEAGGKIDNVEIKREWVEDPSVKEFTGHRGGVYKIKVDSNNCVIIHSVERKKLYTLEEVNNLPIHIHKDIYNINVEIINGVVHVSPNN